MRRMPNTSSAVCDLPLKHARVCAFGMTRRKGVTAADDEGLRALLDSGAKTITLVGKTSAFQVTGDYPHQCSTKTWR